MEKERVSQLELFSAGQKEYSQIKSPTLSHSFFNYIRNYEKIILVIIGLLITGIICFSLGVERGKRLAFKYPAAPVESRIQVQPKIEKQDAIKPLTAPEQSLQYNYTIQLASYQNRTTAQKEAETLKRKGLSALVLSKGKYTVVCVGNFANKETALSLLSELKKRYQDCFIRRL